MTAGLYVKSPVSSPDPPREWTTSADGSWVNGDRPYPSRVMTRCGSNVSVANENVAERPVVPTGANVAVIVQLWPGSRLTTPQPSSMSKSPVFGPARSPALRATVDPPLFDTVTSTGAEVEPTTVGEKSGFDVSTRMRLVGN